MSEEQKQEEKQIRKTKASKATLLKNIKHNDKRYKIGDAIELDPKERESFIKLGIIEE